ncbi:hypothetical protein HNR40_001150 [Nonomuraea endophytica]|uniref:Uncharacterized protein n=1 Tax=Nonomuraea endophytica TaxID=714136 RepID=A0A7W7ZXN9_9ACTN|nr:hypothetical protein [Nonomuraea endophytica]
MPPSESVDRGRRKHTPPGRNQPRSSPRRVAKTLPPTPQTPQAPKTPPHPQTRLHPRDKPVGPAPSSASPGPGSGPARLGPGSGPARLGPGSGPARLGPGSGPASPGPGSVSRQARPGSASSPTMGLPARHGSGEARALRPGISRRSGDPPPGTAKGAGLCLVASAGGRARPLRPGKRRWASCASRQARGPSAVARQTLAGLRLVSDPGQAAVSRESRLTSGRWSEVGER